MGLKSYTILIPDDMTIDEVIERLTKQGVKVYDYKYIGDDGFVNGIDNSKVHFIPDKEVYS